MRNLQASPVRFDTGRICLICLFFSCFVISVSAQPLGVYIGLDQDGDKSCGWEDMVVWPLAAGDSVEVEIYWDNTGAENGLLSMSCTFCVEDYREITLDTFFFSSEIPASWTHPPILNSIDHPWSVGVDQWIQDTYRYHKCWLAQATDFTFSSPLPPGQYTFGTLAFRTVAECRNSLDLIIDGDPSHTGWFTSGFVSGSCTGGLPQEFSCQCVQENLPGPYDPCPTEQLSWGSLKALFRADGTVVKDTDDKSRALPRKKPGRNCDESR